jgi:hypothetical protein
VISIGFPHSLRFCSRHSSSALEALRRGTRLRPRASLRAKHVSAALRDAEAPGDFDKPHSLFSLGTWERVESRFCDRVLHHILSTSLFLDRNLSCEHDRAP